MSIYEEFQKYRDRFGMNQLYTDGVEGHVSQNGALFTMEYLVCLGSHLNRDSLAFCYELDRLCDVYESLEKLPGLTRRAPDSLEGDSMDNNSASLVFSALYGFRLFADRMYEHGRNVECTGPDLQQDLPRNTKYYHYAQWVTLLSSPFKAIGDLFKYGKVRPRYFWNNTRPTEFAIWGWYGRSPGFIALARYCATGKMNCFQSAALWVGQFIGCFKSPEDTDARKLPYIVWQLMKHKNWFWRLSYKLWVKILMIKYPNGMRDVYAKYYQDPNHPIRKYSKPYIGETV